MDKSLPCENETVSAYFILRLDHRPQQGIVQRKKTGG
jgi:hypothetical protein